MTRKTAVTKSEVQVCWERAPAILGEAGPEQPQRTAMEEDMTCLRWQLLCSAENGLPEEQ